jgi:hypothetical protein
MREGKFFVNGAYVDYSSPGFRFHAMADKRLGQKKQPLQVDVQNRVVVRFGNVPEVRPAFEACVVDEDIYLAQLSNGFRDEPLAVCYFANVALYRDCAPACRYNAVCSFRRPGLICEIADGYVCAIVRQTFRDGPANTLIAAGNRDTFSFKGERHEDEVRNVTIGSQRPTESVEETIMQP